jgi:undecaprenyl-diphosphatase
MKRDDILKVAVLAGIAALALTLWVRSHGAPLAGDVDLARRIQDFAPLHRNAALVNAMSPWQWVFLAVAVVLVILRRKVGGGTVSPALQREALSAFALGVLLRLGSDLLKDVAHSPRPSAAYGLNVDAYFSGYGFPSGHVYGDCVVYGLLAVMAPAWVAPRLVPVVRAVCVAVIVLAGPVRVAVGAHWPSDVAGGYLWGVAALAAAVWFGRWVAQRN